MNHILNIEIGQFLLSFGRVREELKGAGGLESDFGHGAADEVGIREDDMRLWFPC